MILLPKKIWLVFYLFGWHMKKNYSKTRNGNRKRETQLVSHFKDGNICT